MERRENVRMLRSDNSSNFTGPETKLNKGFLEMDNNQIRTYLQNLGSDWVVWKKNTQAG